MKDKNITLELEWLECEFSVCRLRAVPEAFPEGNFYFLSRTDGEITLVCPTEAAPREYDKREDGWRCFRVKGELEFSLTGILSGIANVLADAGISIFALSTYNTDYILIKSGNAALAQQHLERAGYQMTLKPKMSLK